MKRFISFLICLLLLGSVFTAYAADDSALQILGYQQNEDSLDVLLYARDTYFKAEDFGVRLEDTKLPATNLDSLSKSECGTSWIVVLEHAPSNEIADMGPTLVESLINHFGPEDNVAIVDSSRREMSSFVRDMPTISPFVKAATSKYTNGGYVKLYDAINTAFSEFKTNTELNPRKCLVIVSACVDTDSVCSLKELVSTAKGVPVTVYTVGTTRGISSYTKAFEELRALSDATPSGCAFSVKTYPSSAGSDAAATILDNEKNCYVLSTDLSGVKEPLTGKLHVSLNNLDASMTPVKVTPPSVPPHEHVWGDDATCQHPRTCTVCGEEDPDGELMPHQDDGNGKCVWCGEPIPEVETAPADEHAADEKAEDNTMNWLKQNLIAVIMGAVLLLLLIVLVIVLAKRKKAAVEEINGGTAPVVEEPSAETAPVRGKVTVELTNKTTGERFSGVILDATLKAGLESALKLSGDAAISRRHMEFIWQNGILYVQDINSKNGTYVNGEKIKGAAALNQNDVIHAGESDFYVTWHSNS